MNRYTFLEYQPGLFKKARVYRIIYTLSSIASVETYFGVDINQIEQISSTKDNLARLLWCGLLDQHKEITIQEARKIVGKNYKAVYKLIVEAITKSLPKKEEVKEVKASTKQTDEKVDHWSYWSKSAALLELKPWEAEKLTPAEVNDLVKAFNDKQQNKLELLAWHVCHIINVWSKKKVKVSDLLKVKEDNGEWSEEDFDKAWKMRQEAKEDA